MEFKAYTFDTIEQADAAIKVVNATLGIPVSPDSVTQTYTNVEQHGDVYIIRADNVTESILGESQNFEIIEQHDI